MSLNSMTDCTVEDNIVQAAHELDRAMADSGYAKCASWAAKWGRPLIEAARENVDRSEDGEADLARAEEAADDASNEASELRNAIEDAIKTLENAL